MRTVKTFFPSKVVGYDEGVVCSRHTPNIRSRDDELWLIFEVMHGSMALAFV